MPPFYLQKASNNLWFGVFASLAALKIKHGISSRLGGVSEPPFSSLNLGLHTGDQPAKVLANRRLFCAAVGVDAQKVVTAQQVHKDNIAVVTLADAGRGAEDYRAAVPETDALITNCPDLPLMLFFADCVPVLIADPVNRAIGISHAGWKGTVARIAGKTVAAMARQFGTRAADCLVGIAPSIGPCCYEVGSSVYERVKTEFPYQDELLEQRAGQWYFNLWEANRRQLMDCGVPAGNITVSAVCTADNRQLFFSYRREQGHTGRLGALISL